MSGALSGGGSPGGEESRRERWRSRRIQRDRWITTDRAAAEAANPNLLRRKNPPEEPAGKKKVKGTDTREVDTTWVDLAKESSLQTIKDPRGE